MQQCLSPRRFAPVKVALTLRSVSQLVDDLLAHALADAEILDSMPSPQRSPGTVILTAPETSPARAQPPATTVRITRLAPQRFALQVALGQGAHDKLRHDGRYGPTEIRSAVWQRDGGKCTFFR